ncbi:MAG TPA: DNA-binding response regulator [Runella sp.]|nr:DNA-binding response regulator [Runella sp.]
MKVLIVEDEILIAEQLQRMLKDIAPQTEVLDVLHSVKTARRWFMQNPEPDLLFMDIQLSDGISFDLFNYFDIKCPIIFATAYDEYAIKAFKVKSIDYLLKPIKPQELEAAITKFKESQRGFSPNDYTLKIQSLLDSMPAVGRKHKTRFLVPYNDQLLPISQEEIAYFYTTNEMVCLVRSDNRQFLVDYTLEELEKLLNPTLFFRLNRQYIASLAAVQKIHTYFNGKLKLELQPEPSHDILVSREKAPHFKAWMEG